MDSDDWFMADCYIAAMWVTISCQSSYKIAICHCHLFDGDWTSCNQITLSKLECLKQTVFNGWYLCYLQQCKWEGYEDE